MSTAQWRTASTVRVLFGLCAIAIDIALWLGLRNAASIDSGTLDTFALVNIPILSGLTLVTIGMFKSAAFRKTWLLGCSVVFEAFTVVVWVQATGTLTTYFTLVGALIVLWYRLYVGFWVAAICTASLLVFHSGAVALEIAGVLRPEALFHGELASAYTVPLYQGIVIWSIVWIYVLMFFGGNAIVNKLRQKDLALAEVRREAAMVAQEVKHGRLTGTLVADEFALGELLGRGGMGEIYVARRISDGSSVALKVLHGHLITDDAMLERFRREAETAGRVPPEHTARIIDVGVDSAQHIHYIAMEHLRGEDLGAHLRRRGSLELDELLPIARGVAAALDAAHAVGVVHRDLKPANIFLIEEQAHTSVRLLDFGMSKVVDTSETQLTQANAVIGTVGYMAPEQALGKTDQIGRPADLFAFSAVLYRALTGRMPFQAGDVLAAIREVANVHPPAPSTLVHELHRDIDAVLAIGLAKDPDERYETAIALVDDLEAASRGKLCDASRARADSIHSGVADAATISAASEA